MNNDPYKYFRLEAPDLLTQISSGIIDLERDGNVGDIVQRLMRFAHTLKGAARVVQLKEIAASAHEFEDLLVPVRDPASPISHDLIENLLAALDRIDGLFKAIDTPAPKSVSVSVADPEPAAKRPDEQFRSVRADITEVDALLDGVAETHALLNAVRSSPRQIAEAKQLISVLTAQLTQRSLKDRASTAESDRAYRTADELRKLLSSVETSLDAVINQMDRELGQLRDSADRLRLVAVEVIFSGLGRLARDIADSSGKRVAFETSGEDIHLDAYVLSTIQSALVQLVRNAVAHGIETEKDRRVAGKAPVARLVLSVVRRGDNVVFRCEDDGRGIDFAAVQKRAEERGLLPRGASPSADDLTALLLGGGISTSATITDAAGRGIGLDVVRTAVEQLGGAVTLETDLGQGTAFELSAPVSVASLQCLLVEAADNTLSIPLDSIRTCKRLPAGEISVSGHGASVLHDGLAIPFVPLSRALFGTPETPRAVWPTVVVGSGDAAVAVGVDAIRAVTRIVVRSLAGRISVGALIAGASLDADGNPILVVNARELVAVAPRLADNRATDSRVQTPVLVIDDSLTTRMLEQSILESAGYLVDLAESAEEGLERARLKNYALILVDVEMPGMNGFDFVAQARTDGALRDVPIIMVSSRSAPEDLRRGREAGANGYIVKGEFNQTHLLSMIKSLVAGRA